MYCEWCRVAEKMPRPATVKIKQSGEWLLCNECSNLGLFKHSKILATIVRGEVFHRHAVETKIKLNGGLPSGSNVV